MHFWIWLQTDEILCVLTSSETHQEGKRIAEITMAKTGEQQIGAWVTALGAKKPTPGGGAGGAIHSHANVTRRESFQCSDAKMFGG